MADYGDFSGDSSAQTQDFASNDPTADFLAREQAILGVDAQQFNAADVFSSQMQPIPAQGTGMSAACDFSPMLAPEPQQETVSIHHSGMSGHFLNNNPTAIPLPASPAPTSSTPVSGSHKVPEIESEAIKQWREKQREQIAERDARFERKRQETLEKAKRDIDKFYEEYNAKREKALKETKIAQESLMHDLNDTITGTVWERVMKHIELVSESSQSAGTNSGMVRSVSMLPSNISAAQKKTSNLKDVTRFKNLLISLKSDKTFVDTA